MIFWALVSVETQNHGFSRSNFQVRVCWEFPDSKFSGFGFAEYFPTQNLRESGSKYLVIIRLRSTVSND